MATGDIGAVIDTLQFDAVNCTIPGIIRISANLCAIPYCGPDNDGFLKTAKINAAGEIDDPVEDTLEFDDVYSWNNSIIHIAGSVYAIAYRGPTSHGWLKTVTINSDGTMSLVGMTSLEFDVLACDYPDIIKVGDGMYAIAYSGSPGHCWIATMSISDAGAIGVATTDTLAITGVASSANRIKRIGDTTRYIVVQNRSGVLYAQSVSISALGDISVVGSQELLINNPCGTTHSVIAITNNIFAVAYQGVGTDGWLKTITANDDGTFVAGDRDSMEFDAADCNEPRMIEVGDNVYAIVYSGTGTNGVCKTVTIHDSGLIDNIVIDTLIFAVGDAYTPELTHVTGNIYAVAYRPWALTGQLKTFDIETPAPTGTQHMMMMGIG